jgi:twinkle protein
VQLIEDKFDWLEYDTAPERPKVIRASTLASQVVDLFYGPEEAKGDYFPWRKTTDRGLRLRRREVTIYAGINGHYKSTTTSQIALGLMRQDVPCLIASFEMRPAETMKRMTRQAAGTAEPSIDYLHRFHKWTDDRLWIFDHLGNCKERQILAVCRYAALELGVKHLFIDSLMKCVAGPDDYGAQKMFVGDLGAIALALDVHVHLIAHARKSGAETDSIDKFSIKGASEIGDQADNLILIQRNKRKELSKAAAGDADQPDVFLNVAKQRNGAYEGSLGFWFNPGAMTLVERPGSSSPSVQLSRNTGADAEDGGRICHHKSRVGSDGNAASNPVDEDLLERAAIAMEGQA